MSDEANTLLKLLADGQWHPYTQVRARLAQTVPPGKALRRYVTNETARERIKGPRTRPELPDEQKIHSGRMSIATDTIASMRFRYVEVEGSGSDKQLRRREQPLPVARRGEGPARSGRYRQPGTTTGPTTTGPAIGPTAIEPTATEAEPQPMPSSTTDTDRDSPAAFINEEYLRTIIAEEVGRALDRFQHGMQTWLGARFAELERRRGATVPGRWR